MDPMTALYALTIYAAGTDQTLTLDELSAVAAVHGGFSGGYTPWTLPAAVESQAIPVEVDGRRYFLATKHGSGQPGDAVTTYYGGERHDGYVERADTDPGHDLALLRFPTLTDCPAYRLADDPLGPHVEQDLIVVAPDHGLKAVLVTESTFGLRFRFETPSGGGSGWSGSPILNDRRELVGMWIASFRGRRLTIAEGPRVIRDFIRGDPPGGR